MSVDDHGWEVLKKSGELVTSGDKSDMFIKTKQLGYNNQPLNLETNDSNQLKVVLDGKVCSLNTTTTPLDADEVWEGDWIITLDYAIIFITVQSDVASATDGLCILMSSDGLHSHEGDMYTVPANKEKTYSFQPNRKYFKVRYTNGPIAQTHFDLETILKKTNSKPSSHRIQDSITSDDDAELVKAVLTGEDPAGDFVNFSATRQGNFKIAIQEYGDTPAIDSFARLRTSTPYTLFDSKQLHDKQPLFWDELIGGNATSVHSEVNANVVMTVTANANDFVIRQTKQRFNYQPAKSALALFTFRGPLATGVTQQIGPHYGSGANFLTPHNGIFLEISDDVYWCICKNGTITEKLAQAGWNFDKLDGSGFSQLTLDISAPQIGIVDYEWLGVGRVRVGFIVRGLIRYVHYFNHANIAAFSSVYMSTPNLPMRYMIKSDGTGGGALQHICSSVMSEGGLEQTGILRAVDNGVSAINGNVSGTTYALIAIRLKSSYLDITVLPEFFSLMNTANNNFRWSLQLNPTLSAPLSYADVANSAVQRAAGTGQTVTTPGLVIDSGYAIATGTGSNASGVSDRKFVTSLRIGSTIAGVQDELVLCATPLATTNAFYSSLTFRELL